MAKKDKFWKGQFPMKNPQKYCGHGVPVYRSSWELSVMRLFDSHPSVTKWASEPLNIPYVNPFTNQRTVYVPDFFVEFVDKRGNFHREIIEVKPEKEVPTKLLEGKRLSKANQLARTLNAHKWRAAMAFCKPRGINFRVMTKEDIFKV